MFETTVPAQGSIAARRCAVVLLGLLTTLSWSASRVGAQGLTEEAVNKKAVSALLSFATFAKGKKHGPMRKKAYDIVINDYDPENKRARSGLGFKKVKGEWKEPPPAYKENWLDKAKRKARYQVQQKWFQTCQKLAAAHRELGLQLMKDESGANLPLGAKQLRQALLYDPLDEAAHQALGHVPWENNGTTYYGTDEQVAFMKRLKELETQALTLAKKEYPVQPVEDLPKELLALGLDIAGAKTKNFTVFTRGTQENADTLAMWGERSLEFLEFCLGEHAKRVRPARRLQQWGWVGFVWTRLEMQQFKEKNPSLFRDTIRSFSNVHWNDGKHVYEVDTALTPAQMHDKLISHVWHYGLGEVNEGLLEGVHHAATWFLTSTCIARYGADPEGTVSKYDLVLPEGSSWWMRELRNQATAGLDTPLNNVPRTKLSRYPPAVRLKAWGFWVWAMARYPVKWYEFLKVCPRDKIPFPAEIDEIGLKLFGVALGEVEAEWRQWASGRGVTAAATGYGPPLLPEVPNSDELDGLERLNAVRRAAGLPECELDAEATMACAEHAQFLGKHPEHHKWPEAHEQDPAKEGFTPRGMRAGMRSVIVINARNAADCIDGWMGTPYHRFPLLEYTIKRFGFALRDDMCVLDMGSLEEPRNAEGEETYKFIMWPPHGSKDMPRAFAAYEHPNPLEDVGQELEQQKNVGYPISLQVTRGIAQQIKSASIALYEAKGRASGEVDPRKGRCGYNIGEEVASWAHTPADPLLKRQVIGDAIFLIPKEHLEANKQYICRVWINSAGGLPAVEWTFKTGSRLHGIGRLK